MSRMAEGTTLADLLLRRGVITREALEEARAQASSTHTRLEEALVNGHFVSPDEMVLAMAEYLELEPISLAHFTPDAELMALVPSQWLNLYQVVPLARTDNVLTLAMADPFNLTAVETLHTLTRLEIQPLVAPPREVAAVLQRAVQSPAADLEAILKEVPEEEVEVGTEKTAEVSLDQIKEIAEEAPVIRIVNSILLEALRLGASDIHIEPMEKTLRLRYRVDGLLYEHPSPPKRLHPAICSRVKILSNLNIAERRIPQDGRFKIEAMGKEADIRVSILPTVHGEKVVMRILDKSTLAPNLDALGLDTSALELLRYAIAQPHGMILVTGPTGSGKTTTLYSCLQEINTTDVNIITVEDPVEYQLAGINQVQTHAEVGLTFANGLRSILRQDPDIVMVGEIRDRETAEIAVQAALTGHLVLSTLHTNDAAGAVARMVNMGIEPFLLASSLLLAQAQRLYRKLCVACREPVEISPDLLRQHRLDPAMFEGATLYQARGCPQCNNLGYKGRAALMELLLVTDAIRTQMLRDADANKIRALAIQEGMRTLRDVGLQKVRDGITTLEEILRVTSGE